MKIKLILTSDDPTTIRDIKTRFRQFIKEDDLFFERNPDKTQIIHVISPLLSTDKEGNYDRDKRKKIIEIEIDDNFKINTCQSQQD